MVESSDVKYVFMLKDVAQPFPPVKPTSRDLRDVVLLCYKSVGSLYVVTQ